VRFSTTNGSNFHEWEAALPEILLVGFIRVYSGYSWFKDIRAGWAEGVVWLSMRWRGR
jgi:membrane-associated phospholipid phosphatase